MFFNRGIMKKKMVPYTVLDILKWKNKIGKDYWPKDVEDYYEFYTRACGGKKVTDVLFSFLGIYAVGVWVYNKGNEGVFKREANKIKVSEKKNGIYSQILCSKVFLLRLQEERIAGIDVSCLNECVEEFARLYFSVGNLIPIWPGGNTLKGNQNNGFMDIPELFFYRYYDWYQILEKTENAYFQEMTKYIENNQKHLESLETFLDSVDSVEKYEEYIEHIVHVIKQRAKKIMDWGEI